MRTNNNLNRDNVDFGDIKKIYLENKEDNHFKFYILTRDLSKPKKWLAQWGRIGKKPQSMVYDYEKATMFEQYQAKLKGGYKLISSDTFDQSIAQVENEALDYLKSIGIDVDSLDDILL
jgi:predicted DNA-binding WGR domain protein